MLNYKNETVHIYKNIIHQTAKIQVGSKFEGLPQRIFFKSYCFLGFTFLLSLLKFKVDVKKPLHYASTIT
jgi:hypothetical protein